MGVTVVREEDDGGLQGLLSVRSVDLGLPKGRPVCPVSGGEADMLRGPGWADIVAKVAAKVL